MINKCIFCGGSHVGRYCKKSPTKRCIVLQEGKCSYCGGSHEGNYCNYSPTKKCIVPHSAKCSLCNGSRSTFCNNNPHNKCWKTLLSTVYPTIEFKKK